jgi:hypothetical protein
MSVWLKQKKNLRQRESVLAGISTTSSRIESATPAATATVQILSRLSLQSSLSLEIGYFDNSEGWRAEPRGSDEF